MTSSPLARPISTLMRPTFIVPAGATLGTVGTRLRENSAGIVPVCDEFELQGVVTENSLARAIGNGAADLDDVNTAFTDEFLTIPMYESGAEALRRFDSTHAGALIVVDDAYRVVGVLRASDLIDPPLHYQRPPMVGGMATPFGVYLTTGSVQAGAKGWALVSTGMVLMIALLIASILGDLGGQQLFAQGMRESWALNISAAGQLFLFALGFRAMPISGIHAAEHMVVHAIERNEPLVPSVVRRMPRVHPRCGTNLATGASLFLGIATTELIPEQSVRMLLALVVTVLFWRKLGGLVQYWITTRPPADHHIEMAIRSAKELLENQSHARQVSVSWPQRLYNSGMFHVMAGSTLVAGLVSMANVLFKWNLPI